MSLHLRRTTDQWSARVIQYLDSAATADREKARHLLREAGPEQALFELAAILQHATERPRWVARIEASVRGLSSLSMLLIALLNSSRHFGWNQDIAWIIECSLVILALVIAIPYGVWRRTAGPDRLARRRRIDNTLTALIAEAGLARSGAAVLPLLDVAALLIQYPNLDRDNRRLLSQLQSALARLLPKLDDDEAQALTPMQRALLRDWIGSATAPATSPAPEPLVVGALLSLAAVRDPAAIPNAVWLARHHSSERLRTAAAACARAAGSRDSLSDPR